MHMCKARDGWSEEESHKKGSLGTEHKNILKMGAKGQMHNTTNKDGEYM